MAPSRVRIPPSPLAQRPPRFCAHPRRGGRAVECGGLENRYPSLGGSRVQIPPPPLFMSNPIWTIELRGSAPVLRAQAESAPGPPGTPLTRPRSGARPARACGRSRPEALRPVSGHVGLVPRAPAHQYLRWRRRWPKLNRPSGRKRSGRKITWPAVTRKTRAAMASPIATVRIIGLWGTGVRPPQLCSA
jgi:hypothetical protein